MQVIALTPLALALAAGLVAGLALTSARMRLELGGQLLLAAVRTAIAAQGDDVKTLSQCGTDVVVVADGAEPPAGCGVAHVSAACQVHVLLKGVVDAAAEIKRIAKKLAGTQKKVAGFEKRMGTAVYVEKVPAAQKAKDAAKLAELKKEAADLAKAQKAFEDLAE